MNEAIMGTPAHAIFPFSVTWQLAGTEVLQLTPHGGRKNLPTYF